MYGNVLDECLCVDAVEHVIKEERTFTMRKEAAGFDSYATAELTQTIDESIKTHDFRWKVTFWVQTTKISQKLFVRVTLNFKS